MLISRDLQKKYNQPVPRYTSYPPAPFFSADFGAAQYSSALKKSNSETPQNISLYIHIPFCPKLCLYCGCNTVITHNKHQIRDYLQALKTEILLVRKHLAPWRRVSQIHWGGGTPNYLKTEQIQEIMALFRQHFSFIEKPEIAIECNPAYLTLDYLNALIKTGFNRFSLGIQDFAPEVLKIVHRDKPAIPIAQIMQHIRQKPGTAVNLDFIYGLPRQTPQSFEQTMRQALELRPDRLVTFSYAHVPWVKKSQQALEKFDIPQAAQKLQMFEKGYQTLTQGGYEAIGLDHYALPDDELSIALKNKNLHRNFQGYCTKETTGQVYAFGSSAISQTTGAYAQNTKDVALYIAALKKGELATEKGYALSAQEKMIRQTINEIMCNQYLSWSTLAQKLGVSQSQLRQAVPLPAEKLNEFELDGMIQQNEHEISVSPKGKFFIRNIAAAFDPKLKKQEKKYSSSI